MTRETVSAVFVAVLLVLASGTAVSLAVTDSSTSDVGTSAVGVQDAVNLQEENASVTFDEQASDGEQIVVESATLPEGGFIAIHDGSYTEAPVASVLGSSVYLEPGTHENVTITLARPVAESQTLVAMPHLDTNENQVFDYVLSTGEIDSPYTADGEAVVDEANVTVGQETTTTTEEAANETTTTTEEAVQDTTTGAEAPGDAQRFVFQVEQMNIDQWSFVVGDEQEPDRTQTVGNVSITDRRVNINLSQLLRQSAAAQQAAGPVTTVSPERAEEILQENLTQDIQTVRYVVSNVTVENVTFVVTAPEDVELPQPPMTTQDVVEETTTEEEEVIDETTTTTEEEEVVDETTEEEDVIDETTTTTTEEEDVVEETTTTTEEEAVEETTTTTEEEEVEETTTTTTEEAEAATLDSFTISNLDAPSTATANDTITVSATVSNPNDQQATQPVTFRLEGTVVARQPVTLDAGEQTTVSFEVDTSDVPAGQYIHGVYTRNFGDLAVLVVEQPSEATTTAAEQTDDETTVATDETTVVADDETTVVADDETTTATV